MTYVLRLLASASPSSPWKPGPSTSTRTTDSVSRIRPTEIGLALHASLSYTPKLLEEVLAILGWATIPPPLTANVLWIAAIVCLFIVAAVVHQPALGGPLLPWRAPGGVPADGILTVRAPRSVTGSLAGPVHAAVGNRGARLCDGRNTPEETRALGHGTAVTYSDCSCPRRTDRRLRQCTVQFSFADPLVQHAGKGCARFRSGWNPWRPDVVRLEVATVDRASSAS